MTREDAVSRQAVLKAIRRISLGQTDVVKVSLMTEDYVKKLPPVYPQNTDVLDKIRAEIEQYQADCDLSCSDDANCRTCDNITFGSIYRIIDKYRKGDNE